MDKKNYIGKTEYGYIFQRIGRDGLISGFNEYNLVETVDGTKGLECIGWTRNINLDNGKTYKSGDKAAKVKKCQGILKDCTKLTHLVAMNVALNMMPMHTQTK